MQFSENGVNNTVQRCVCLLHANADYFLPHGRQNPAQHRLLPTAAASVQQAASSNYFQLLKPTCMSADHFMLGQVPQLSSKDELLGTAGTNIFKFQMPSYRYVYLSNS